MKYKMRPVIIIVSTFAIIALLIALSAVYAVGVNNNSVDANPTNDSTTCNHIYINDGVCANCNNKCTHSYTDGICSVCNMECSHNWNDSVCKSCNVNCQHDCFTDGICNSCEYHCAHENHASNNGKCSVCQAQVFHSYVDGSCVVCDRTPVFHDTRLPDEYYEDREDKGTIHTIDYETQNYLWGNAVWTKTMKVWTPYNYDESIKYNVLVLMHGGGGSCDSWIDLPHNFGSYSIKMCNIYDKIVEENNTAPFIIVSIPAAEKNDAQIASELRNDILPYVVDHFSTWAKDSSVASISEARDHFGIGGLSNGSVHTFNAGMSMCYDLFGNYMGLSAHGNGKWVLETINSDEYKNLSVRCLYAGCGTKDGLRAPSSSGYQRLVDKSNGRYVEGSNAWYLDTAGGHDWNVWSTGVYNALQVMF